jgi:hypothetical protein
VSLRDEHYTMILVPIYTRLECLHVQTSCFCQTNARRVRFLIQFSLLDKDPDRDPT